MFEKVIVPLDGSDLAERVLPMAAAISAKVGGKLILIHAVESVAQRMVTAPSVFEAPSAAATNFDLMQQAVDAEKETTKAYLSSVKSRYAGQVADIEAVIIDGDAAHSIVGYARQINADLIAMSTHGRGGLGRLVFGSVADAILRSSRVPVLMQRPEGKD